MLIGGRARHIPSGSNANRDALASWGADLRLAAVRAVGAVNAPPFVGLPLRVSMTFRMARPSGHWGKRGLLPSKPRYPATKPDLDKLIRSTGDVLSGIVFDDDSRIVALDVEKVYAEPGREGATITIRPMP